MSALTFRELMEWKAPSYRPIIGYDLLPRGQVCVLYGEEGTWKSWIALKLADAVSKGEVWMSYPTIQSRVLLLNTEITQAQYQKRVRTYAQKTHAEFNGVKFSTDLERKLDTTLGLNATVVEVNDALADIIIIDDLYRAMAGDMTKSLDVNRLLDNLNKLRVVTNCAIFIIAHARQAAYDTVIGDTVRQGTSELFGMTFLKNWFDTILEVRHTEIANVPEAITLTPQKHRLMEFDPLPTTWRVNRPKLSFELYV
jgi:RecA-family ATPase